MIQLAIKLDQILQSGPNVFLSTVPEIIDFTKDGFSFDLILESKKDNLSIEINKDNIVEMLSLLKTAFSFSKNVSIISWNIKNVFSTALAQTGLDLEIDNKLFDLKVSESFFGIKDRCPQNFDEAAIRAKNLVKSLAWNKYKALYQDIYLPLIKRVVPSIETIGVFNTETRHIVYPYYEINSQVNSRFTCQLAYEKCFNPHSLAQEQREKLQPRDNDQVFLSFDYSYHEVCILAWLSKDEDLNNLVAEGDFYKNLFKLITGSECNTDVKRDFCKKVFLPTVYGQSARLMAEKFKFSLAKAEMILAKLHNLFPKLFDWVTAYPSENGEYEDFFGKKRRFEEHDEYKYRNFIIQSPAAIFCLDKLVQLYDSLQGTARIAMNIHDAYIVCANKKHSELAKSICMKVLEGESRVCPGLSIKVDYKMSKTLA